MLDDDQEVKSDSEESSESLCEEESSSLLSELGMRSSLMILIFLGLPRWRLGRLLSSSLASFLMSLSLRKARSTR